MVNFLQLTMLQLGGEVKIIEHGDVEVSPYNVLECSQLDRNCVTKNLFYQVILGSVPFCCLAPFTIFKRPLTPKSLYLVTKLINQVPYVQFTILYLNMR